MGNRLPEKSHDVHIYKKWYFWVCGFIILSIALMIFFSFYLETQAKQAEENRNNWANSLKFLEYAEVDYNYLFENAEEYVNKNVLTAIKIVEVERINDGRVKANTSNHTGITYDFDFVFDDINEPMTYESGDYVTIIGKVKNKSVIGNVVTLEHCHIIDFGNSSVDKMLELEDK